MGKIALVGAGALCAAALWWNHPSELKEKVVHTLYSPLSQISYHLEKGDFIGALKITDDRIKAVYGNMLVSYRSCERREGLRSPKLCDMIRRGDLSRYRDELEGYSKIRTLIGGSGPFYDI